MNSEQPTNGTDDTPDDTEFRALLEPFAGVLRSDAVWAQPPEGLGEAIVSHVRAAAVQASPESSALHGARTIRRRWVRPALAAAAIAAAFAAGLVVANPDDDDVSAIADVDLAGTDLAPDASATGDVVDRGAGYAIRLVMAGLPPAPEGEYYEGWLRADDGEMVSVGTFHMRSGDSPVVLWSGVRIAEYNTLVVTEETERSGQEASDRVVLEGLLERR